MQREQTPTTLVSTDPGLIHLARASAAAISAPLSVTAEADDLRVLWRASSAILIGADQVDQILTWALPHREQVYLVGQADSYQSLCRWSMPLGAAVILLPEGSKWLTRVIAGHAWGAQSGMAVAIRGGVGGVGASTLCASLAVMAAQNSMSVALVDCDPHGGGIDLLLGAENAAGWRWDKLRNAVGQIADITSMLPRAEGITMVSMERASPAPIPQQALEAVTDCLGRSHDLVLLDIGRGAPECAGVARRSVLVTSQTVRAIAAARVAVKEADSGECGLVIRKPGSVSAADAARAVELPLITALPTVPELARQADRGVAPWVTGGWKKACDRILQWCLGDPMTKGKRR